MGRTSAQVPAAIWRVVRYGPRRGETYQNPIVTFSGCGSGSSCTPSVARPSTPEASSSLTAVTVTSAPRLQRETSIVQPSPSASVALRSLSRAERSTVASGGSRVASGFTRSIVTLCEYGCSPDANRPRNSASTTSEGESLSSTLSRIGSAWCGSSAVADMAPMIRHQLSSCTRVSLDRVPKFPLETPSE